MVRQCFRAFGAATAVGAVLVNPAIAQSPEAAPVGQPHPWQIWHQEPSTPVMEQIASLHGFMVWISVAIVLLVMALTGYVVWRFNERRNPVPARFSHNQLLEFAWTAVPVLILVIVAIPSFKLLYFMDRAQDADMTIKVTGHQWYWSYEYPDHGGFVFDSFMKYEDDLEPGEPRLLAVDNEVVLPVGATVRVLMTSNDVIHAWAIPALGVKTDNVPGRLTETWMRIDRPGVYYGQCSELCGVNHGFMPIAVRGVSPEEFEQWVGEAQEQFAKAPGAPEAPTRLAQAAGN